jgi:hypothetical protein
LELANLTIAAPPAASFRETVSSLRDELTRAAGGLTEIEERVRNSAGAETSLTWLTPTLPANTPRWPFNDTTLPFTKKRNAPGTASTIVIVGLAFFTVAPAVPALPATKALLPMAMMGAINSN